MNLPALSAASAIAVAALTFLFAYVGIRRMRFDLRSERAALLFLGASLFVFNFEFYALGPYSFIDLNAEGNLTVAANYYFAHHHDGGRFAHAFAGGQDAYAFLAALQYINLELLAEKILPTWGAILFHKMYFVALTIFGAYMLALRFCSGPRLAAVAVALILPLSHDYFLNFSTNWGTGFSALPIAVYAALYDGPRRQFMIWIAFAAFVVAAADPIHLFPPLGFAMLGVACFVPTIRVKRVAIALIIYVVASILVWHEFLYATAMIAEHTNRAGFLIADAQNPARILAEVMQYLPSFVPIPAFISIISLVILISRADRDWIRGGIALALPVVAFFLTQIAPWDAMGLGIIGKISHNYVFLSFPIIMVPLVVRAIASIETAAANARIAFLRHPVHLLLAVAIALLSYNKTLTLHQFLWFGGQGAFFGYQTLKKTDWRPEGLFRVVTLSERPPPNNVAAMYGLESFDGQPNLNLRDWADFWSAVVWRHPNHIQTGRPGLYWEYWNGREYRVEDHLRLEFLALANVRFVLSALPLASDRLKLISRPDPGKETLRRPSEFPSFGAFLSYRLRRIFDPGDVYIYELFHPTARVQAATNVVFVPDHASASARLDRLASEGLEGIMIASETLRGSMGPISKIKIHAVDRIVDGYSVSIDAPLGGYLVVNNIYLPFWEAWANGHRLNVKPVNQIHFAVQVPPGTEKVTVVYRRPLLRETISTLLGRKSPR